MMKVIKYSKQKTKKRTDDAIYRLCDEIMSAKAASMTSTLGLLCGTICYRSVFNLPEYFLVDNKPYSIEDVVCHIPGLFKLSFHEMLNNLSEIAVNAEYNFDRLKPILCDPLIPEMLWYCTPNSACVYATLVFAYLKGINYSGDYTVVQSVYSDSLVRNINVQDLFIWFNKTFNKEGYKVYE